MSSFANSFESGKVCCKTNWPIATNIWIQQEITMHLACICTEYRYIMNRFGCYCSHICQQFLIQLYLVSIWMYGSEGVVLAACSWSIFLHVVKFKHFQKKKKKVSSWGLKHLRSWFGSIGITWFRFLFWMCKETGCTFPPISLEEF